MKSHHSEMSAYRCDICRQPVDLETDDRARRGWQPLVVCERCVREAQTAGRIERLAA
jgi:DNA-directed RNA polymerase subunit RPC12/RpoP